MRWLLNSAVLAAGQYGLYRYSPATREDLTRFVALPYVSRIGYPETAGVIKRWTGTRPTLSREVSALAPGDEAMVVRLGYRVDPALKGMALGAPDEYWEIARLVRVE
jgi:hypothetical protein